MSPRANVTSVEAIEAFRASLIVYLGKARPTLDEVSSEIMRTRLWLQGEQRTKWETEFRRRTRRLEDAKQALFGARMSNLREVSAAEQMAVTKAKRAVDEAEEKLKIIRRWDQDFENRTEPLARRLEKLQSFLADDLNKAVAYLTQTVNTLEAYAGVMPSAAGAGGPGGEAAATAGEPGLEPPPETAEEETA